MTREFQPVQRIGPFAKGELPGPLQLTFKDSDGAVIPLGGYSVEMEIVAIDQVVSGLGLGAASIPTPANGITEYIWAAADMGTVGLYRSQMWVGNGVNRFGSEIFEYFVREVTTAPSI